MRSKDVVFYENKFHDFENITKDLIIREDPSEKKLSTNHVPNHDAENQENLPEIENEENLPPVRVAYEENFMKQLENISTKRQRKAPENLALMSAISLNP